jgi:uncharacterized membrane protein YesL
VASRAESIPAAAPGLGRAVRSAVVDFYFNSWRLVPANLLWGTVLLALLIGASMFPPVLLLTPALALPTVGVFRIAALIARGESVSFWDGLAAWRTMFLPALVIGTTLVGCAAVFLTNIVLGLTSENVLGWVLATLAAWGLLATWVVGWTIWPLVVDPRRAALTVRSRVRIGLLLVLAHPLRLGAMGAVLAVLLAASTVAFAALVSISVAFAALIASRYVLPAADRLEQRLSDRVNVEVRQA